MWREIRGVRRVVRRSWVDFAEGPGELNGGRGVRFAEE